jgi:hypothetical protein
MPQNHSPHHNHARDGYELAQVMAAYAIRKSDADEDHGTAARLATASHTFAHDLRLRDAVGRAAGRALAKLKRGEHDRATIARAMKHRLPTLVAFMRRADKAHASVVASMAELGLVPPSPPNLYSVYALLTHAVCHDLAPPDFSWLARVRPQPTDGTNASKAPASWTAVTPHDIALVHLPGRDASAAKQLITGATDLERALVHMGGKRAAELRTALSLDKVREAARFLDQQPLLRAQAFDALQALGLKRRAGACGAIGGRVRIENARINASSEAASAAGPGKADVMTAESALNVLAPDSAQIASAKNVKDSHVQARRAARAVQALQGRLASVLGIPAADPAARAHALQVAFLVATYLRDGGAVSTDQLPTWIARRSTDEGVHMLFDPEEFHADSPLWAVVNESATRLYARFVRRVRLADVFGDLLGLVRTPVASPRRALMAAASQALVIVDLPTDIDIANAALTLALKVSAIVAIQATCLVVIWALIEALSRIARAAGMVLEFEALDLKLKEALNALAESAADVRLSGDEYARALDTRFRDSDIKRALTARGARLEKARKARQGPSEQRKHGSKAQANAPRRGSHEALVRSNFSNAVARLAGAIEDLSARHFPRLRSHPQSRALKL